MRKYLATTTTDLTQQIWHALPRISAVLAIGLVHLHSAHGQALPAATREPLQIGVEFSTAHPDYTYPYIQGVSGFGTLGIHHRFSLEGDVHIVSIITPADTGENTYLIGPRYNVLSQDRFRAYIKVEGGIGRFQYQSGTYRNPYTDTYGVIAPGGGFEYRAARHLNVRVIDVSIQRWQNFPPNGLTPLVFSFGAAYVP